ncbi:hypothetical protein EVAR_19504_1 [Eumeta japonica]|uniref:Mos1 transposase HTH domain-containing protein n=1 Tax=Eumeta variegata TaxID=151549 RepID=A0A4C1V959_EUMVA|nr:hypothetical protein EVAR_19504_1 [Eumeta japonica]
MKIQANVKRSARLVGPQRAWLTSLRYFVYVRQDNRLVQPASAARTPIPLITLRPARGRARTRRWSVLPSGSSMIFCNFKYNLTAQQSLARLRTAFGDETPCKATIYNWFAEFKRGRVNLSGEFRDGHSSTAVNNKTINAVCSMMETYRHVTYYEMRASSNPPIADDVAASATPADGVQLKAHAEYDCRGCAATAWAG